MKLPYQPPTKIDLVINKYEAYISNIKWHITVNKPAGSQLDQCRTRINDMHEMLRELQEIKVDIYKL